MNVLDFAASAVKSLAWPATAVIAIVLFRVPLTKLIGRIRRVTVSDGTAVIDFRAALASVETQLHPGAARLLPRARVAGMLQSDRPPAETIDAAWTRLQAALGQGTSPVATALAGTVAMLHALRNQAIAGRPAGLTAADALRFEDAASAVQERISAA